MADPTASAERETLPGGAVGSREKILDVAEALFARRGFAGVGLREVAESAGLGKSSLFHHFRSKVELYLAVVDRVLERIRERVSPVLRSEAGPAERLDGFVDALIDALAEHPPTARLLLRGLFEDDDFGPADEAQAVGFERNLAEILGDLHALFDSGIQAGVFRPVSRSHMIQTLIGATVYHFASGEFGEELIGRPLLSAEAVRRRKEEVKSFLRHGLSARP
jgi:TetR/AcrR family transcriptional regulator